MKRWLAIIGLVCAAHAWGQAHDEGVAAGRAANPTIRSFVSTPSASSVVPGYTATPPEIGYYGLPNLAAPSAALIAQCRTAPPGDVRCQAITTARDSAANPHPPIAPTDPSVVAATAIANNPSSILGAITGTYSACGTQQRLVSPATFDQQSCYDYYRRAQNQLCQKTRTVRVDWSCPVDQSGPNATFNPATGENDYTCTETTTRVDYTCPVGYDLFVAATGENLCREQANPTNTIPATPVTVTVTREVPAIPTETDLWDNGCSGLEARVPPGLLPPDGEALPPGAQALGPGVLNKCQRTTSVCSDAVPATRRINSKDVTRACWQWTNSFDCVDLDPRSDCSQPRFGQCAALGPRSCIDQDTFFSPPVCTAWRTDFQCQTRGPVYDTVADCGTQQFCTEGTCWDTGHPPDADFARTVTLLEAQREAGKYLDVNALRVFKGFDNRCDKKLFGLVNCCNRGGTGASGLFSNLSLILSASGSLGRAGFSSYTYDALFTSDAPNLVVSGFEALFGTGLDSGLAGILAGDLSVADFVISLAPGPWTLAMLAIQYSGLLSCPQPQQVTAMKRDTRLCKDLGEYCSQRLPIIRTCLTQTHTFCCFNSRLARLINEQGRTQLGRGWGTAQQPDCSGFSVAELQALDFARMDLSEFYAEIAPTLPNAQDAVNRVSNRVPQCYFGQGQC